MIRGKDWLTIPQAARHMGMSRQGALKRLKRLDKQIDNRLLWRAGEGDPWLVSVVVLAELNKIHERDWQVEGLKSQLGDFDTKLTALRNSYGKFRRVATKRLDHHEALLKRLHEHNKLTDELFAKDPCEGN